MLEIRIHGYGGQGSVTLAHLLAQAALDSGSRSQALPSFGVERRGAPVKAAVRISDEPILIYSQSVTPDVLVCMDKSLVDASLLEGHNEDYIMVVNSSDAIESEKPAYFVDAVTIALEEGLEAIGASMINIPLLGAVSCAVNIPADILENTLRSKWDGKVGEKNVKAAMRGYESIKSQKGELS